MAWSWEANSGRELSRQEGYWAVVLDQHFGWVKWGKHSWGEGVDELWWSLNRDVLLSGICQAGWKDASYPWQLEAAPLRDYPTRIMTILPKMTTNKLVLCHSAFNKEIEGINAPFNLSQPISRWWPQLSWLHPHYGLNWDPGRVDQNSLNLPPFFPFSCMQLS
jgi:hypothetical protein